jgi:hypothetical protein
MITRMTRLGSVEPLTEEDMAIFWRCVPVRAATAYLSSDRKDSDYMYAATDQADTWRRARAAREATDLNAFK